MFKFIAGFISETRAVTAIEFSVVFIPFFASILFIAEMCRVSYISSAVDLILAESAQSAAQSQGNFQNFFNRELAGRINRWPLFGKDVEVTVAVNFCRNISEVLAGTCSGSANNPLALYSVNVKYSTLFMMFTPLLPTIDLTRNVLLVQESHRVSDTGNK